MAPKETCERCDAEVDQTTEMNVDYNNETSHMCDNCLQEMDEYFKANGGIPEYYYPVNKPTEETNH